MPKKRSVEDEDLIEEPGAGVGHNSVAKSAIEKVVTAIEQIREEIDSLKQDEKAALEVAAQNGLDKKMIREVIKQRALDQTVREERESLRDLYLSVMGLK